MTKTVFTREAALAVATDLRDQLAPLCERIEIAGSIRRMKREVSDAELLYIPKFELRQCPDDMFARGQVSLVDLKLDTWLKDGTLAKRPGKTGVFAWGTQNKLGIHVPSGLAVDFFATDEARWWVSFVIRTGGKVTNVRLTTGAKRRGHKLHAYGQGLTLRNGEQVRCGSEMQVFVECGVPYAEPWERE